MEPEYFVQEVGQEVQSDDLDLLGETAALADDRTLATLLRMMPYDGTTYAKAVMLIETTDNAPRQILSSDGPTGKVRVAPFLAIVGSRPAVADGAKLNFRDIRSALFVPVDDDANYELVSIASNSSGDPRWDLVYALVVPDVDSAAVTRYVQDPTTLDIDTDSVVVTKVTTVTVGVATGATAPSPALPATPTDAGGNF